VFAAAVTTIGVQLVATLLSNVVTSLVAAWASHPVPFPVTYRAVYQTTHFLLTVATTVVTGYTVGRLAPTGGVRGLVLGRAVWFVLVTLIAGMQVARSSAPTGGGFIVTWLTTSFFWFVTITVTEVLIAGWAARRTA
jgi:uncharacterized protein (DUF2062 family)